MAWVRPHNGLGSRAADGPREANGRLRSNLPFRDEGGKAGNRRIPVVFGRSGEGPLSEPRAAARPWQREPLTFAGLNASTGVR
jgi:hypothetical protein